MKSLKLIVFLLISAPIFAQTNTGVITYEEVLNLNIELPEEMQQYAALIPKEKKSLLDLFFNENESLYTKSKAVAPQDANPMGQGGNMQVQTMMIGGGGDRSVYLNNAEETIITSENSFGQNFLIEGTYEKKAWKILNEQKEILGYTCIKAEMEKDSTTIEAWFTPEIAASVGPSKYYGLPGAILSLSTSGEASVNYEAIEVKLKDVSKKIAKPTKGKKVSEDEFELIMEERMNEMEKMYGGNSGGSGNSSIRIITN